MDIQELNESQMQAVTAPLGPVLVLAGAGSGKTRVLTNRIVYLVKQLNVSPDNILAITFTNKAADEMKRRLWDFDCNAERMRISTIHSFCAYVLRNEAAILNKRTNFTIYTEDDKKSVLKKIVKEQCDQADAGVVDCFSDIISHMKNQAAEMPQNANQEGDICSFRNFASSDDFLADSMERLTSNEYIQDEAIVRILSEYDAKMTENNALDFDDLLYFTHKLFSTCKDVLSRYSQMYRYICIDEFQDTNKVQYEIFKMLAQEHRNIFVVGDDDQSIYSWRGADVTNILNFEKDFVGASVYKLEQNYRSTKRILDVANCVIEKNSGRYEKKLWTENESGVKVEMFSGYNEQDEAYYVVHHILGLLNNGYSFRDCAVLMRINALSRTFEQEFIKAKIPYKVFGGFKFYERREIKDVLSFLRLIDNPYDNEAFLRAINAPVKRGIGETTLGRLRNLSAELCLPMVDVISDERNIADCFNASTRSKLMDFFRLYDDLCQLASTVNLAQFLHQMLDILEFRQTYIRAGEDDRAHNVDEFEQSVIDYQTANPYGTLADFLQTVSLSNDKDDETQFDYVTVATIHAVKGLEFKAVFVVGMDETIFPSSRSSYDLRDSQEERRLMYVAATRAKKRLYLTHASSRFIYGQRKPLMQSRFYAEITRFLQPREAVPESRLWDDGYLDKLNRMPTARPASTDSGKSKAEMASFKVGQMVMHSTFGKGIIIRYDNGVADVVFETVGKKSLNVKFAPLSIVK
ncbi:MAG: UvrD-helicase domain-containing protein [Corallococcus sp.]|nr:UvrD-helicase domain-containing protein [Corallococcus sp.]